jgi:hypothetical protein
LVRYPPQIKKVSCKQNDEIVLLKTIKKIKIMFKKSLRIVSIVAIVAMTMTTSLMVGCQKEEYASENTFLSEKDMIAVASEYLVLENDQYRLDLSEAKAIRLGISKSYYAQMMSELVEANAFIEATKEAAKNDPNIILCICDPKKNNSTRVRLKSGNEGNDDMQCHGSISPSVGSTSSLSIPNGITTVQFNFSGSFLGCSTTLQVNTGFGNQVLSFITILSISCVRTVTVPATPARWTLTTISNQGSNTISIFY